MVVSHLLHNGYLWGGSEYDWGEDEDSSHRVVRLATFIYIERMHTTYIPTCTYTLVGNMGIGVNTFYIQSSIIHNVLGIEIYTSKI